MAIDPAAITAILIASFDGKLIISQMLPTAAPIVAKTILASGHTNAIIKNPPSTGMPHDPWPGGSSGCDQTGEALLTLRGHQAAVSSVAFSPDGRRIVSGSFDNTIKLWDAEKGGEALLTLRGHQETVLSVAFSPDGKRIVSGSEDNTIKLWDAEKGGEALLDKLTTQEALEF